MGENVPTGKSDQQTAEVRRQARRKDRAGILVGLSSVAAGFAISCVGVYGVESRSKTDPLDRAMTELAFIGVGILATSTGCLFAREMRQQADVLNRRASELSKQVVATHLTELPQIAPPSLSDHQAEEPPTIVLFPEQVATLPTSTFVPPKQLP